VPPSKPGESEFFRSKLEHLSAPFDFAQGRLEEPAEKCIFGLRN